MVELHNISRPVDKIFSCALYFQPDFSVNLCTLEKKIIIISMHKLKILSISWFGSGVRQLKNTVLYILTSWYNYFNELFAAWLDKIRNAYILRPLLYYSSIFCTVCWFVVVGISEYYYEYYVYYVYFIYLCIKYIKLHIPFVLFIYV